MYDLFDLEGSALAMSGQIMEGLKAFNDLIQIDSNNIDGLTRLAVSPTSYHEGSSIRLFHLTRNSLTLKCPL
jgi:hypothetical protein